MPRSSSSEVSVETSRAVEFEFDEDEVDSRLASSGGFGRVSFGGGEAVRCAVYEDLNGEGGGDRLDTVPIVGDIKSELEDWKKELFVGDTGERS